MDIFTITKHLCSWAGLSPQNDESPRNKKSVKISRAGCYIKPLLVQCATAVVKSEKHPEIRNRYSDLKKPWTQEGIIAIDRMLTITIYHILKKKEPYKAELYKKSDIVPVSREITIEQVILIVQRHGCSIKNNA